MKKLYIIGNGFDIFHGLRTKYSDFREYCNGEIDDFLNYCYFDCDDNSEWNKFESKLGDFDCDLFYEANCLNDQCESWGEGQGVADDIKETTDSLIDDVEDKFNEWIGTIELESITPKINIDKSAKFLTFNYTSVLQDIYKIPIDNALHIHGSVKLNSKLIFGHNKEIIEEPEIDENGDSNRTMYTDVENAAKYPLYAFKKRVVEILSKNEMFFNSLTDINQVVVFGHSLNDIDLIYFKKVANIAKNAEWTVSYYNDEEKDSHLLKLKSIGIIANRISLVKLCEFTPSMECHKNA